MAAAAVDVAAAAVSPRFSIRSLRSSILSRALAVREDTSLSLWFQFLHRNSCSSNSLLAGRNYPPTQLYPITSFVCVAPASVCLLVCVCLLLLSVLLPALLFTSVRFCSVLLFCSSCKCNFNTLLLLLLLQMIANICVAVRLADYWCHFCHFFFFSFCLSSSPLLFFFFFFFSSGNSSFSTLWC